MSLYEGAVKKPIMTSLCFLAVAIFGLFSLSKLPVDLYPDIDTNTIMVMTSYQGASASDIENNVTRPLENTLNSVSNLKHITSKSSENISVITLEFEYGYDIDVLTNDVRDKLDMVSSELPDEVNTPIIFKFSTDMIPILLLSVQAEESQPALYKILDDNVVNPLARVPGVGTGLLHGGWLLLGNSWYYLDPGSHIMLTGFMQVGTSSYILTSSGAMATGWALADGTWYYAASNGAIQRGRWIKSGNAWYYLDDVSGAMRTGEYTVGDTRYYSFDSGAMASSCWINLSDGMAWANSSGALSEPLPTSSDGSPVVADRADLSSLPGTIHIGDAVFYVDASGAVNVTSGWIMSNGASGESDNTWYYASSNGVLKSGWQYVNGAWYWMDPSTFKMKTGWLNDGGTWYWLQPSGAMFANGWLKIDGVDYYFNASGAWLNTSGSVLGVNRSSLVNWLMSHENDGYYRGTRYDTHLSQETCMYPKGDPRWDGYTGMNCGGFVSHAYMKAGGNLAPIAAEQSHSPWSGGPGRGGCVNAYRWYGYAIDTCANVTYFNSIDELLRSGLARKGYIVFFNPYNQYADDSHIGFFWGNTPSENLFWHSDGYGNRISGLTALSPSKVILIR